MGLGRMIFKMISAPGNFCSSSQKLGNAMLFFPLTLCHTIPSVEDLKADESFWKRVKKEENDGNKSLLLYWHSLSEIIISFTVQLSLAFSLAEDYFLLSRKELTLYQMAKFLDMPKIENIWGQNESASEKEKFVVQRIEKKKYRKSRKFCISFFSYKSPSLSPLPDMPILGSSNSASKKRYDSKNMDKSGYNYLIE